MTFMGFWGTGVEPGTQYTEKVSCTVWKMMMMMMMKALDALSDYFKLWKMIVNASKTKIIIFYGGKIRNKPLFKIIIESIDVVDEYIYLGTTFCCNGSFKKAIMKQISQAKGAMFRLAQRLNLPIDIVVELYDQSVLPILLYGSEIWGFSDISAIEVIYIHFFRSILKLNKSTANCMVYGELGKCCIMNSIKERMVIFWSRLVTSKQTKI